MTNFARELAAVQSWVDETDQIAMSHFGLSVATETKQDGTPVTVADRGVEQFLRASIEKTFPGDGVVGEEYGTTEGARRWIIDPIDGTKNYARGIPVFATLIALEQDGELVLGMVSAPALRARWWGIEDEGAFKDGEPIRVSETKQLDQASVCTGGIDWARKSGRAEQLVSLEQKAQRIRGFGDFWGHMLVAQGSMEVMIEFAPLAPWDVAGPKAVVEQAGGRMTALDENATPLTGPHLTTNAALHDEVLRLTSML